MKKYMVYVVFGLLLVVLLVSCAGENTTAVTTSVPASDAPLSTAYLYYPTPEGASPFDGMLEHCTEITQYCVGSGEILAINDSALLSEFFAMLEDCEYTACETVDSDARYVVLEILGYSFYFGIDGSYLYKRPDATAPIERFLITGFDTALFNRVLDAFPESVLLHPFDAKAYPESIELRFVLYGPSTTARDTDAIRAYIDMLHACRFERIEHTKTEQEILQYQYFWYQADFDDGSQFRCYYIDVENGILYLLFDYDIYHAYLLEGFDKTVLDALLASVN